MDQTRAVEVIRQAPLFARLDPDTVGFLASAMRQREVPAGTVIYQQDTPGDSMLVILRGRVAVKFRRKGGTTVQVATAGPGEILGELSFLDPAPRSAQVEAMEPCLVCELDRMVLHSLYQSAPAVASSLVRGVLQVATNRSRELEERIWTVLETLHAANQEDRPRRSAGRPPQPRGALLGRSMNFTDVPLPPGLSAEDLATLAGAGNLMTFSKGEDLCQEGERGLSCFIILRGRVEVLHIKEQKVRRLALLPAGSMLGQIALVADTPRTATVRAGCDLVVLELSRDVFDRLLQANNPLAIRFQEQIAITGIRQNRRVLKRLEHVVLKPERRSEPAPKPLDDQASRQTSNLRRPTTSAPRQSASASGQPIKGMSQIENTPGTSQLKDNLEAYLASLGEWGISVEEMDAAEVGQPEGLITQAELRARRQWGGQ